MADFTPAVTSPYQPVPEPVADSATPPTPAPTPAPAAGDTGAVDDFHDAMADPRFLRSAALIMLDHGLPQGVQWLANAHQAVQENGVRAAQALIAGDGARAVQLWNQSGEHTDATGATKNDDGTWTITRKAGPPVTVDPMQELSSFLSPAAYLQQQTEKAKAAANAKEMEARGEYYKAAANFQGERANMAQAALESKERINEATNRARELEKEIAATPGMLRATRDETAKEYSAKYGLPAFLTAASAAYRTNPVPDPSDPDGKRMLDPSTAALNEALRSRPDLVAFLPDPKGGGIVAVDRSNPKTVLRRFANVGEMQALGIQPTGAQPPQPEKKAGFLDSLIPYFGGGVTSPVTPPAPSTNPAAQGVNPGLAKLGDDVRRVKRLFGADDDTSQRTATGKIR